MVQDLIYIFEFHMDDENWVHHIVLLPPHTVVQIHVCA